MFNITSCLHRLNTTKTQSLPKAFTYPFLYTPHALCVEAAKDLQQYLETQTDFIHNFGLNSNTANLAIGKMFGVMVVQTTDKQLRYIAAFSGKLAHTNHIKGFVPPVFDNLTDTGFYKKGEHTLNILNAKIEALENADNYKIAKLQLQQVTKTYEDDLAAFKLQLKADKAARHNTRNQQKSRLTNQQYSALLDDLKQQSIYNHFRLRDFKTQGEANIATTKVNLEHFTTQIQALKQQRKQLSASLQQQLHAQYAFLNYNGDIKDLTAIFKATKLNQPPAGAGECAAPKLFQYAYKNQLKPIAMAEFWWGSSPKSEIRKHKQFYPSCRGKCEPILGHMMQGLTVDPNPILHLTPFKGKLEVLFEDEFLMAINKPNEFLSVPGITEKDSVQTRIKTLLPNATGPLLLHRLDMSTSGILLIAKNKKTHKNLQKQFINRSIKKRYVADLQGVLNQKSGTITLPLRVDLNNRPRQLVCETYGKPAITNFNVISTSSSTTRVYFYPLTGRTHQLRVHAAHVLGLNSPIVGDDLYGVPKKRLHLHAEQLQFIHPVYNTEVVINSKPPF